MDDRGEDRLHPEAFVDALTRRAGQISARLREWWNELTTRATWVWGWVAICASAARRASARKASKSALEQNEVVRD